MKMATLVCRLVSGGLTSIADDSVVDLLEKAREARQSGLLGGKPIDAGMVMCSWRPGAVMQFRLTPNAESAKGKSAKGKLASGK